MSEHRPLRQESVVLSDLERRLINAYQGDIPLDPEPFMRIAENLGVTSEEVQQTLRRLLDKGVLTRFGPLYNIEKADGSFSLCALKVPEHRFDEVADQVNGYAQVAHNYQREHEWNMWFVLATEDYQELEQVFEDIKKVTGCPGLNLPKQTEFFVGLKLQA